MKTVTKIPPKRNPLTFAPLEKVEKRRVAAYARVSTDSDEQKTSYDAQVDYYTKYIKERSDWEFVGIYTDEGISATNTKHRDGFNRMVADVEHITVTSRDEVVFALKCGLNLKERLVK